MKNDEKKMELLKKLKALAERGVGGEKEGAQKKMEQLMKKYGIEDIDLLEEKVEDYDFRYHDEIEKKLIIQIFYKVVPDFETKMYIYRYGKGSRSMLGIACTKAQALQIQVEYEFYRELWKEEKELFFSAFLNKHNIFGEQKNGSEEKELTEKDLERLQRMQMMICGMQDKSLNPMVEVKV